MEFEERRLVAWEVLPRARVIRIVQEPDTFVEVAHAGKFWRVPAKDVVIFVNASFEGAVSVLCLPDGVLSLMPAQN